MMSFAALVAVLVVASSNRYPRFFFRKVNHSNRNRHRSPGKEAVPYTYFAGPYTREDEGQALNSFFLQEEGLQPDHTDTPGVNERQGVVMQPIAIGELTTFKVVLVCVNRDNCKDGALSTHLANDTAVVKTGVDAVISYW